MGRTARSGAVTAVFLLLGLLVWTASLQKRAELLELGDAVVRQEEEIRWLKEERALLLDVCGSVTDLEETEKRAGELGMSRPRDEQILYGFASLPDRVEITGRETPAWRAHLQTAAEYIRHIFADGGIGFE